MRQKHERRTLKVPKFVVKVAVFLMTLNTGTSCRCGASTSEYAVEDSSHEETSLTDPISSLEVIMEDNNDDNPSFFVANVCGVFTLWLFEIIPKANTSCRCDQILQ